MPAVSTLYHDRHRAALSYTVRAVSYWNCATSIARPLSVISTLQTPSSNHSSAQLVCILCIILSMRNANRSRPPSHWCTIVEAALKLAKLQNVPIPVLCNLPNPVGHDLSRPRKCQFPLPIRTFPRGNVNHRVFVRCSSCKDKSNNSMPGRACCPVACYGLLQPVDTLLSIVYNQLRSEDPSVTPLL
jgi:hypothetical protein